jgi:drug/metabolite transporter (DMT)-like permease
MVVLRRGEYIHMTSKLKGSSMILISAGLFGIMGVAAKLAYNEGANTVFVLTMRFSIASVILWLYNILPHRKQKLKVTTQQAAALFLIGGVVYYGVSMLYYGAINYIPVSLNSMIFYLYPFMVNVFMIVALKERIMPAQIVALLAAMIGSVMMMWSPGIYINWLGVLIAFCSSVCFGAYIIMLGSRFTKVLDGLDSITVTTYLVTFAALAMLITGAFTRKLTAGVSPKGWIAIVVIAFFSTVISSIAFYLGVREIGSSKASILSTFEPVVTVSLGILVLKEILLPTQIIGIILVISAVVIMNVVEAGKSAAVSKE